MFRLVPRILSAIGGGGRRSNWCGVATVARQAREEGRDFERHLVARRGDGDRSRLHHFRFVVPGIDLHASAQGQSCGLVELAVVEGRTLRGESRQAADLSAFCQRVAEVRREQRVQAYSALLQSLEEQGHVVEL